jgi:hypothetical protein
MRDPEGLAGEIADPRAEDDAALIASETAQPLRIETGVKIVVTDGDRSAGLRMLNLRAPPIDQTSTAARVAARATAIETPRRR